MTNRRVLDLFCGAGGLAYGFAQAGFEVRGVDRLPVVEEIFRRNALGKVKVKDLHWETENGGADVVIGGPPCRPWSTLNLTRRTSDHANYRLMARFMSHVFKNRPRAFLMENVPAAMSHGAHAYYVVAEDLEKPPKRPGVKGPVPLASGVKSVVGLPAYRLDQPPIEEVEVLRAIAAMGGKNVKKKGLVKMLLAEGWEREVESNRGDKTQAALMRLNRLLERLERVPKKVAQEGRTRRRRVSLTEEGSFLLTLLG
jgi:SAM-dependent methyltransferase